MRKIAFACLLMAANAPAAPPTFRADPDYLIDTWEVEDGLPEGSATSMVQDQDGYLWFGTFGGLVRFDGVKFAAIDLPTGSGAVVNLHLDHAGRLWVSTYRGITVREQGRWREITTADGWKGDFVRTFSERSDGDLLVTTFDGRVLEFKGGQFHELPCPPGATGTGYLGIADGSGQWCVAQHKFIGRWDGAQWLSLVPEEDLQGLGNDAVGIARARDGGSWVLLGKTLRKYHGNAETTRILLSESPGGVWGLSEDSAGHVWITSYHAGLSRVSSDGAMRRWSAGNGAHHALRFSFEDREHNIWIGTSGGGLQRFKPRRFRAYGQEAGLTERNVSSLSPARDGVFVGTYGGGLFRLQNERATPIPLPGVVNVQSVLADRSGRTWVGTYGQGWWLLENGVPRRIPDQQAGGGNGIALFEDSRGRIWFSGGQTVVVFENGSFREIAAPSPARGQSLAEQRSPLFGVMCFAEDSAGKVWFANAGGVFRTEDKGCVSVLNGAAAIRDVTCLHAHRDAMWLYSTNRGLLRWQDGEWMGIRRSVFPASIHGIVEDGQGSWWMLTSRGIVRATINDLETAVETDEVPRLLSFHRSDGLPGIEGANGRSPVCGRDADGKLWFATNKGVASIDPTLLRPNLVPPSVQFESLVYRVPRNGLDVETRIDLSNPIDQSTPLILPAGSRRLEFHYAAPSFSAPEKMRFEMRMHETKSLRAEEITWIDAGSRRVVEVLEGPSGDFMLSVRASNDDEVWSFTPATIRFTVEPFYWQTTTFIVAVGSGLTLLGGAWTWLFVRARWRRAGERERAAHEIRDLAGRLINAQEAERSRIARELHDDLSQSIALMSVRLDMLAQNPPTSLGFAGEMRDLANQTQRISTEMHRISHELHPAKLEQLGLVPALRGFCREMGTAHHLPIAFSHDTIPENLPPDIALCLYRVVQESLHNVIKHAHATHAEVRLTTDREALRLVVTDDGTGFDVNSPQTTSSLGFVSMKERVRLVNGTLKVESQHGKGTRVEVVVKAA